MKTNSSNQVGTSRCAVRALFDDTSRALTRTSRRDVPTINGMGKITWVILASLMAWTSISLAGSVPPQLLTPRDASVAPPAGGNGDSCGAVVSPNGRFVVFSSAANNLVLENDRQIYMNVYLRDRASNATTLVSVGLNGTSGGNGDSLYGQVSTNGQYVLFESLTGNLVAGYSNWMGDIYIHDLVAGTTAVASLATNGGQANCRSYDSVMTPNGRYVAFASMASNLVVGDTNNIPDIFVRDVVAGTTTLVSVGATGSPLVTAATPQITPDGNYVAFCSSATGMVAGASANGEVYVRDLVGGTTTWASIDAATIMPTAFGETVSNLYSYFPRLSGDGQLVTFKSTGTNVTGLTAILVYDQVLDLTTLITTNAIGSLPDDENRYGPEMTASGRFIAYASQEPGGGTNVYVWDSLADTNILVSTGGNGVPTNTISDTPVLSGNGRYVVFRSNANNLVTNAVSAGFHIYLRDLQAATTRLVDVDTNGVGSADVGNAFPSISADGWVVVFSAPDGQLVSADFNNALDVFARDTLAGTTELDSPRETSPVPTTGDAMTRMSPYSISGNGRWMVFESFADDLVPNDTNGHCDVFLRDLRTGQTSLVSAGLDGNSAVGGNSDSAVISGNSRYVAFASGATNLTADSVTNINIFRRDLQAGTTTLISANAAGAGTVMTNYSDPVISADGRYIAYLYSAKSTQNPFGTYWRDINSNSSVSLGSTGPNSSSSSPILPSMSADGRYVTYLTNAMLKVRDTQLGVDVYTNPYVPSLVISSATISPDGSRVLYQTSANAVNVDQVATGSNLFSFNSTTPVQSSGQWSGDSRYIVFTGITNTSDSVGKVYLCDLATSNITLISYNATNGNPPNAASDMPSISGNGRFITFRSYATDIVAGDTNPAPKVYLLDRLAGTNAMLCAAQTGSNPFPWISAPVISAGAENVAFLSVGSDLATNDINRVADAFAVRVLIRIQIAPVVLPGKTTALTWQTVPLRNYQVQFKDNLTDAQWQDLPATISFIGNEGSVTVPADQPNRFYQVVENQ